LEFDGPAPPQITAKLLIFCAKLFDINTLKEIAEVGRSNPLILNEVCAEALPSKRPNYLFIKTLTINHYP